MGAILHSMRCLIGSHATPRNATHSRNGNNNSNPLMMGYGGGDLLRTGTVCQCLASGRVATQACVCRLWAVACVASGSGSVTKAH